MTHKFDPHFTEEQNRAYALMLLREGFEQLHGEDREKALSLIAWRDKKGELSDKQWWLATKLASGVSADKLDLNFATDADVKPKLAAIVDLADKLIQAEHDKGKADMGHFVEGLDKAKQFAAAYGAGSNALKTDLALVNKLKDKVLKNSPQLGSWIDNEINAIVGDLAAPKKPMSWAKALAKTPAGKPVMLGLDYAKGEGWTSLADVADALGLPMTAPLTPMHLQSTAGSGKALTIAEAKTLLLHVAAQDSVVAALAKLNISEAGGINSVLVKAGFDPKLPPNDTFDHAAIKGDLITYYGSSHMFSLAVTDLKIVKKDHAAFIATEADWDPSYKAGVMTLTEAHKQAMEHYPPHGVSPWQAKQALLMMASAEPVLMKIGFDLQDALGGFKPLVEAAKLGGMVPGFFKATKADLDVGAAGIDFSAGTKGFFIPLKDLKSKHWGKTAGGQLPYAENTKYLGCVEPSAEFGHDLMVYSNHEAKNVLKMLVSNNFDNVTWAFGCVNKAGGINAILAAAGVKDAFSPHKRLIVQKSIDHKVLLQADAHTVEIAMDYLHDIEPVPVPGAPTPDKPLFANGPSKKVKLALQQAMDANAKKQKGKTLAVAFDNLKAENLWSTGENAYEVHVNTKANPASVIAVLFEKLFKKWDVVTEAIGPHNVVITFPIGSIHPKNIDSLKAVIAVAEGYVASPLDKIMDDWKTLDAPKPALKFKQAPGQGPIVVKTIKAKGLVFPKKKQA